MPPFGIIIFMEKIQEQKTDTSTRKKTLVSVVTPFGEGGIGKIIVSGPNSLSIVNKVFQGKGITDLHEAKSRKLYYGYIFDKGQRIDEVIVHVIRQGDSFTGEYTVEINCHGGIRVVMRIYECLQSFGAEGVEWNSLIGQSFENDKMDFIQKEALQEITKVRTKLGAKVLLDQYAGALSGAFKQGLEIIEGIERSLHSECYHEKIRHGDQPGGERKFPLVSLSKSRILHTLSIEKISTILPSINVGEGKFPHEKKVLVSILGNHICHLLETASLGIALTMPQVLVILGKPNVGKSTIINAILEEDRMLVHHEPGTTRDYVSEFISVDGIPFELIDTAGIRDSQDMLETMGMEMALGQLQRADKVMVVFDNSRPFDHEDKRIVSILHPWSEAKTSEGTCQKANPCAIIPVMNKCDLPAELDRKRIESGISQPLCYISAQNRDGLEDLKKRLVQTFDTTYRSKRPVIFNMRQYSLLAKADIFMKQNRDYLIASNVSDKALQVIEELQNIFMACLKGN